MTRPIFLTLAALAMASAIGCGKEERNSVTDNDPNKPGVFSSPTPFPCTGYGCVLPSPSPGASSRPVPAPSIYPTGATARLTLASSAVFRQYVITPVNNWGPVHINVELSPMMDGSKPVYLGQMRIRYIDDQGYGRYIEKNGEFYNGSWVDHKNDDHILTTEAGTNIPTYRIFGEDPAGVIIVTMQASTGSDIAAATTLRGKVFFRNFLTTAPNPLYSPYTDGYTLWPRNPYAFCWTIETGPYNCRNFSVQPTGGSPTFTLLGTFTGLNKQKALGE